jgi:hypothetical protein
MVVLDVTFVVIEIEPLLILLNMRDANRELDQGQYLRRDVL